MFFFKRLLMAGMSTLLWGGGWAPIPPEVWAIQENAAQGVKGAVVLEDHTTFTGRAILHVHRVRVLSDSGRDAAAFPEFLPEAREFEGRTVHRDGSVVLFDSAKDFKVKVMEDPWHTEKIRKLIPPGVTSDCVVEVRWVDFAMGGHDRELPWSLGYSAEWLVDSAFKILENTIEFTNTWHWSALVMPGRNFEPEVTSNGRARKYVFRNLPGREAVPFSLRSLAGFPTVVVWHQPDGLVGPDRGDATNYWKAATQEFWKPQFHDHIQTGRTFRAFADELLKDLPSDPLDGASTLLRRLDKRIRNVEMPTLEEKGSLDLKAISDDSYEESHDLDRIVQRGAATGSEMDYLFLALLEKEGVHPLIALVKSRSSSLFHFEVPDVYQPTNLLVGIPVKGKGTLWLEPDLRYAAPGLVHPSFQGWEALVINTANWKPEKMVIPFQPARFNMTRFTYQMAFQDGLERFSVKSEFSGYPEYFERRRFLALSPVEQNRKLKESLEKGIPDCAVSSATVKDAVNPDANVTWTAEGNLERSMSETFHLDPFPGMPNILSVPTSWPEKRTEPIVLNHLGIQLATCEFMLPKGFALVGHEPMTKENSFGKVNFLVSTTAKDGGTLVKVVFRVDILRPSATSDMYNEFKTFVGWVDEAYRRELVLEKQ